MMAGIKKWLDKKKLDMKFRRAGEGHSLAQESGPPRSQRAPPASAPPKRVEPVAGSRPGEAAIARFEKSNTERTNTKLTGLAFKRQYDAEKRCVEAESRNSEREQEARVQSQRRGAEQVVTPSVLPISSIRLICPITGVSVDETEIYEQLSAALASKMDEEPLTNAALMIHTLCRDRDALQACITTVCKYLDNILSHPDDPKYRKIKLSNKSLQEKVVKLKGGMEFLQAVGFQRSLISSDEGENEFLVLPDEVDMSHLVACKDVLTDMEPLTPKLDRCARVFKAYHRSALRFELPDSFFALSKEELKQEQQQRTDQIEKDKMLRTKAMREQDMQRNTKRYRYAAMRVRFPDETVLQGTFKPGEKVETVRSFVVNCMKEDAKALVFSLMDSAGKRIADEKATLIDAKLVPSALMTLSFDPEMQHLVPPPYLRQDLLNRMQTL